MHIKMKGNWNQGHLYAFSWGTPMELKGTNCLFKMFSRVKVIVSRYMVFNEHDMPCVSTNYSCQNNQNSTSITQVRDAEYFEFKLEPPQSFFQFKQVISEKDVAIKGNLEEQVKNSSLKVLVHIQIRVLIKFVKLRIKEFKKPMKTYYKLIYQLTRDQERRQIRPSIRYSVADLIVYALMTAQEYEGPEPPTYKEAINSKESKRWLLAIIEEFESLQKNHNCIIVDRLGKQRVVGCKWIFKRKEGTTSSELIRFKARLVVKMYTQKESVDFNEVFFFFSYCEAHFNQNSNGNGYT